MQGKEIAILTRILVLILVIFSNLLICSIRNFKFALLLTIAPRFLSLSCVLSEDRI